MGRLIQKPRTIPLAYEEEYFGRGRDILKGDYKVAILDYNPTLQYYLGIPDRRLLYLGLQLPAMGRDDLLAMVEKNGIGWFVIDTNSVYSLDRNIEDLSSLWGKPERVGGVMIFGTGLWNFPGEATRQ